MMWYVLQTTSSSTPFNPVIVDVRSVKAELECKPVASNVELSHIATFGSQICSEFNRETKLAVADLKASSCPGAANTSVCFAVCCFTPSSVVSLRPLTSFAVSPSLSSAVTGVTDSGGDYRVSHSIVKQEHIPSGHPSDESSDSQSAVFAGHDSTAQNSKIRVEAAEDVVRVNPRKSSKTTKAAAALDTVLVSCEKSKPCVNSKWHVPSKAANVDDAPKGKRAASIGGQKKSDTKPVSSTKVEVSRSGDKLSSAKQDIKSQKRKFQKAEKSGIYALLLTVLIM